jgi:hypothetical protein
MNNSQKQQQQRILMRNSIQFQYFYRIICGSEARPEGPAERIGKKNSTQNGDIK